MSQSCADWLGQLPRWTSDNLADVKTTADWGTRIAADWVSQTPADWAKVISADWVTRIAADWLRQPFADWVSRTFADWAKLISADWVTRIAADWVSQTPADWAKQTFAEHAQTTVDWPLRFSADWGTQISRSNCARPDSSQWAECAPCGRHNSWEIPRPHRTETGHPAQGYHPGRGSSARSRQAYGTRGPHSTPPVRPTDSCPASRGSGQLAGKSSYRPRRSCRRAS